MKSRRQRQIENYLYENKTATLHQLCDYFDVSINTIRRDIDELTKNRNFKKIYGGVTVVTDAKELLPFAERHISRLEEKKKIARKAAEYIVDGDVIFIDSGTTTLHMVDHIKESLNVTVITNSLEVLVRAANFPNIKLITLSGEYNNKTFSFVGEMTTEVLKEYNVNKCFMAATGISVSAGATNSSIMEYYIKEAAVEKSQTVYVLADSSKFNTISLRTFCMLEDITYLITDAEPPKDIIQVFNSNNHSIILA